MKTKQPDYKNILIINPFGIGDVLFSTPLVKAVRKRYPGAFIGYLSNRRTEELLVTNPNIDEVFVYEKDEFRRLRSSSKLKYGREFADLLSKIRKKGFDLLIDLSLGHQYSVLASLMGIRNRIGFNYKGRGGFLTQKIDIDGYEGKHIVEYYLSLLRFIDTPAPGGMNLEFFTEASDRLWANDLLKDHSIGADDIIVGIVPGGGTTWGEKATYKHWPEEKFAGLIDRLSEELRVKVIMLGSPKETDKCNRIASLCKSVPINACGKTNLGRLAATLSSCDIAVANDGGPLHIAVSQGIPTVSVFGPVDEVVYGPYPESRTNTIIKNEIDCRPCYRKFKIPDCNKRICLKDIEVAHVFTAIKETLSFNEPKNKKELPKMEKIPLSVVVLTKNEEANIAECLRSVSWADDIIVVDDFSSDKTLELASRYTDKIFKKKMEIEGIHRNWAYGQAKNRWILSLDADEAVTPELKREIETLIKEASEFSACSVPLRNYIGPHWVRHGGWYPAGKVRLFQKGKFSYEETGVHPRVHIDGKCGHLKCDIIHKGYPDFAHFLDSLNRQTTLEAQKWVNDKRRMSFMRALRKANDRFFKAFFLKKGYKDGVIGYMVAFFAYLYQIISYAKYWELRACSKKER